MGEPNEAEFDDVETCRPLVELPVTDWEDVARRVRLPSDLCEILGLPATTLRWSREKYALVIAGHPEDRAVIEQIEVHVTAWDTAGLQVGRDQRWNVFFEANDRTYIAVFGPDRSGSFNMITVYGSTNKRTMMRRRGQPGMYQRKRSEPCSAGPAEIS